MSVCKTCHVPYTKRDVYALDLSEYAEGANGLHVYRVNGAVAHASREPTRALDMVSPSSPTSESTSDSSDMSGLTIPALLQRIHDLDNAVRHRDLQIEHWRAYVLGYVKFGHPIAHCRFTLRHIVNLTKIHSRFWFTFEMSETSRGKY